MDIHGYVLVYSVTSMKRYVCCVVYHKIISIDGIKRHWGIDCMNSPILRCFAICPFSFEVVQALHEKLLDMVGKIQ